MVLPAPFGPSSPQHRPGRDAQVEPVERLRSSPYRLRSPSTSIKRSSYLRTPYGVIPYSHTEFKCTEYTGSGDPERSMELLWGDATPPSRGPKPKLDLDRSSAPRSSSPTRRAWTRCPCAGSPSASASATMSLYTYVPGKAELLDVMLDTVVGEPAGATGGLARAARPRRPRELGALPASPLDASVTIARPPLGPNVIAKYDYELAAIDGIGLTDLEMDSVLTLVPGTSRRGPRIGRGQQAEQQTGHERQKWWEASRLLERVLDPARYPVRTRIGAAAGEASTGAAYAPDHGFEFGLQRILDGDRSSH